MLFKSARTVSSKFYMEKRVYLGLTSYRWLRVLGNARKTCLSCCLPSAYSILRIKTLFCTAWKMTTTSINPVSTKWIVLVACLVHKICGYFNKGEKDL